MLDKQEETLVCKRLKCNFVDDNKQCLIQEAIQAEAVIKSIHNTDNRN